MKKLVLYIHGKGGSAAESGHFQPLFPDCEVVGLDYRSFTPWETGNEIREAVNRYKDEYGRITLIANSIGAYFSMNAGIDGMIQRAYFISPIVDLERLICDRMRWAKVTEEELRAKGTVPTSFGEDLRWDDLCYVRSHPIGWDVPTQILYGTRDNLTSLKTVRAFAEKHGAALTVMENAEHWFHTPEQMQFLDQWIRKSEVEPMVELRVIAEDNFIDAFNLKLRPGQERFVSHPIRSLAQAYVYREQCQPFGIYADGKMVGYVMVIYDYDIPEYDIWHMMIDESMQGHGYGGAALDQVIGYIKTKPFGSSNRVALTCSKDNPAARELYESRGFAATGAEDEEEIELVLNLRKS